MISSRDTIDLESSPTEVDCAWEGSEQEEVERNLTLREQAGYERGLAEGERLASERIQALHEEVKQIQAGAFEGLSACMPEVRRDCEEALVSLALETARKLVSGLPISPSMVESAMTEALSEVDDATDHHVYLHPDDLELLQRVNSPALMSEVAGRPIQLHSTPEVTRGGCLVKTRFGVVDARRETKLAMLEKTLWT